jgi:hypothetical protein
VSREALHGLWSPLRPGVGHTFLIQGRGD